MVDGTCTKFSKKLFGPKVFEIGDKEWPEMKNIVSRETVSFF
jgi:hypothetical protein